MNPKRRYIVGDKGFVSLRTLIWTLLIILGCYSAYMFGMPYVEYYMLKTDIEQEAKNAHMYTDERLAIRIIEKASTWAVPLDPENLIVERSGDTIRIQARYRVKVVLIEGYEKVLKFNIEVEKPVKETTRILQ